jgi:hypothetical protein
LFGGIDDGRLMLEGNIGWPYYPRFAVHYGLSDRFSVGGSFALGGGYAGWWGFGMNVAAPIRWVAYKAPKMSLQLRFDPGVTLGFGWASTLFTFNIPVAANFGYEIPLDSKTMSLKVGGGIETGIGIMVGSFLASPAVAVPILIGPAAELRVTKNVTIPIDIKLGPSIGTFTTGIGAITATSTGASLGYKFLAGVTYTL